MKPSKEELDSQMLSMDELARRLRYYPSSVLVSVFPLNYVEEAWEVEQKGVLVAVVTEEIWQRCPVVTPTTRVLLTDAGRLLGLLDGRLPGAGASSPAQGQMFPFLITNPPWHLPRN